MSDVVPPSKLATVALAAADAVAVTATAFVASVVAHLSTVLLHERWGRLGAADALAMLRVAAVLGLGVAFSTYRRPGRSARYAALECLVLAYLVTEVTFGSWVGAVAASDLLGAPFRPNAGTVDASLLLREHLAQLATPWAHLPILGLAVSLFLVPTHRGRWTEGLVLALPVELAIFLQFLSVLEDGFRATLLLIALWCVARTALVAVLLPPLAWLVRALVDHWNQRDD